MRPACVTTHEAALPLLTTLNEALAECGDGRGVRIFRSFDGFWTNSIMRPELGVRGGRHCQPCRRSGRPPKYPPSRNAALTKKTVLGLSACSQKVGGEPASDLLDKPVPTQRLHRGRLGRSSKHRCAAGGRDLGRISWRGCLLWQREHPPGSCHTRAAAKARHRDESRLAEFYE